MVHYNQARYFSLRATHSDEFYVAAWPFQILLDWAIVVSSLEVK